MRKSTLKKHLESLEEEELRSEILLLFDKFKEVKNHYKIDLGTAEDRSKIYEHAKEEISKCFRTKSYARPRRPRIKIMKTVVKRMEKSALFEHDMIDIHLHVAEAAVTFMNEYEYLSDTLFNAVLSNFELALGIILRTKLEPEYQPRVQQLVTDLKQYFWVSAEIETLTSKVYNDIVY